MENNVPSTVERLGVVDYEALRRENPGLIMLRMPAFGINGPYKNYRALGMHMEGAVGHTWVRGYPDSDPSCAAISSPPTRPPASPLPSPSSSPSATAAEQERPAHRARHRRKLHPLRLRLHHGLLHERPGPGLSGQPPPLDGPHGCYPAEVKTAGSPSPSPPTSSGKPSAVSWATPPGAATSTSRTPSRAGAIRTSSTTTSPHGPAGRTPPRSCSASRNKASPPATSPTSMTSSPTPTFARAASSRTCPTRRPALTTTPPPSGVSTASATPPPTAPTPWRAQRVRLQRAPGLQRPGLPPPRGRRTRRHGLRGRPDRLAPPPGLAPCLSRRYNAPTLRFRTHGAPGPDPSASSPAESQAPPPSMPGSNPMVPTA